MRFLLPTLDCQMLFSRFRRSQEWPDVQDVGSGVGLDIGGHSTQIGLGCSQDYAGAQNVCSGLGLGIGEGASQAVLRVLTRQDWYQPQEEEVVKQGTIPWRPALGVQPNNFQQDRGKGREEQGLPSVFVPSISFSVFAQRGILHLQSLVKFGQPPGPFFY